MYVNKNAVLSTRSFAKTRLLSPVPRKKTCYRGVRVPTRISGIVVDRGFWSRYAINAFPELMNKNPNPNPQTPCYLIDTSAHSSGLSAFGLVLFLPSASTDRSFATCKCSTYLLLGIHISPHHTTRLWPPTFLGPSMPPFCWYLYNPASWFLHASW